MDIKILQREKYMKLRKGLSILEKEKLDSSIYDRLINTMEYRQSKNILTYVSMGFEVDTLKLINHTLELGKNLYVPLVTKEKRVMKFYKISSLEELVANKWGILEPKAENEWVSGQTATICIVPALAYDLYGYRIGYGGGYYDNFLSKENVETIGIAYDDFIIDKVEIDCYDQSVKKILTEHREINIIS